MTIAVDPIVTGQTGTSKILNVGLRKRRICESMAGGADSLVEGYIILPVAVAARKWRVICYRLMTGK